MAEMKRLEKWKPEGLMLQSVWVGYGTLCYTAFAANCDCPVGSTWVRLTSNGHKEAICYIVDIYVPEQFRRNGIGTFMMKWLLDNYGILKTGGGTKSGGLALMKSLGWKQNRETTEWYLRGKPKKVSG